jgi:hypothetical protein
LAQVILTKFSNLFFEQMEQWNELPVLPPPPGLEEYTPAALHWYTTYALQHQWISYYEDIDYNHNSEQCLPRKDRVRKYQKKPLVPGLVIEVDDNIKDKTLSPISELNEQQNNHLLPRENKGQTYYEMIVEFYNKNRHTIIFLTFNLKGRDINRVAVEDKLKSPKTFSELDKMLFENMMQLVYTPTVNSDKPWVRIPIIILRLPFGSKHFLDIETKIRDKLKDILKAHLKPSDRIQLKEISEIPESQYALYQTRSPINVGSSGHWNGKCKPCQNLYVSGCCKYGDKCSFCHFSHKKKNQVNKQNQSVEENIVSNSMKDYHLLQAEQSQFIDKSSTSSSSMTNYLYSTATVSIQTDTAISCNSSDNQIKKTVIDQTDKVDNDQTKKAERILELFKSLPDEKLEVVFSFKVKAGEFNIVNPPNEKDWEDLECFLFGVGFNLMVFQQNKTSTKKKDLSRLSIETNVEKIQLKLDDRHTILEFERKLRSFILKIFIDNYSKTETDNDSDKKLRHRLQLYQIMIRKDGKDIDMLQKPKSHNNLSEPLYCSQCGRVCACNAQSKC